MMTSPARPLFDGGYNAVLLKYGEYLRTLARTNHLDFADLNTRLVKALNGPKQPILRTRKRSCRIASIRIAAATC